MGGGFLWELSPMLFVFNGGFTKQPQPGSSIPLDHECGWDLVGYTGTASY